MSKPADPTEVFRSAMAITTASLAAEKGVEVSYSADGGRLAGDKIILNSPPRKLNAMTAAIARGEADKLALTKRYHDPASFSANMPTTEEAMAIYEGAERARIEALGAKEMDGVASNLDAILEERCERAEFMRIQERTKIPQAESIEFLLREKLTGKPLPPAAEHVADFWRSDLEKKAAGSVEALAEAMHDQGKFAEAIKSLLRDLELGDETSPADEAEDPSQEPEEAEDNPEEENTDSVGEEQEEAQGSEELDQEESESEIESDAAMAMEAESDFDADQDAPEMEEDSQPIRPNYQPGDDLSSSNYKAFSTAHDEVAPAETLCDPEELSRLASIFRYPIARPAGCCFSISE